METSDSDPSDVIDASADLTKTAAYAGAALSQMKKMGQQDENVGKLCISSLFYPFIPIAWS